MILFVAYNKHMACIIELYYRIASMIEVNLCPTKRLNDSFLNRISDTEKWRIPLTALKRLDDAEYDWNIRPSRSPELPNMFLEPASLFIDLAIPFDHWNWKNKSKCFPLVDTAPYRPSSPVLHAKQKVKMHLDVIERLALMEAACNQLSKAEQVQKKRVDLGQGYGIEIDIKQDKPIVTNQYFLPKRDLDDFQILQACLLNDSGRQSSQEKKRACELGNRFRFD
jgi:hypothetical protein